MISSFIDFLKDLYNNRMTLWNLSINDLKSRFSASFLGVIWAIILPLVTMLVLWFVFQIGLKSAPVADVPFIVWLIPSYLVWTFTLDCINGSAGSILEYQYLVKKVNFRVSVIPIVKINSALLVHLFFILFIFFVNLCYGITPSIYNLQVIYYLFAAIMLFVGLGWLVSALVPFVPDVLSLVNVLLQIGFWGTPIVWNAEQMSPTIQLILKMNPFYYICQGYRNSFVTYLWFWESPRVTLYYWSVVAIIFILGAYVFKKMRPQFADVL